MPRLDAIKSRIHTPGTLSRKIAQWRMLGKKIVFTNGVFDILHPGHIDYLSKAADLGDVLLVGINSDASARKQGKGSSRPIQDENSRTLLAASLHFVDAVILFAEETPLNLIKLIQPDVLVKGADYDAAETNFKSPKYIVGSAEVKSKGGKIITIPLLEGFSTTAIEKRIKNS